MKTKLRILQGLLVVMLLLGGVMKSWAQVGSLTQTGDMGVCLNSTEPYGVALNAGSTYAWSIVQVGADTGDGTIIPGATGNLITVNWTTAGTCTLRLVETNSSNCPGPNNDIRITVNPLNTVALLSAAGTDGQTICLDTPITDITYTTTGATGATFAGLPTGVTGSWTAGVATIAGIATEVGTFNYTVTLTGGCGTVQATGTITVITVNTLLLTSATGTDAQSVCINNAITDITYETTGATGADVTGLPNGVTGTWSANVLTISGTPSESGTFTYTVTLTGGCGTVTTTGTITVNADNTIALTSALGTDAQTLCINSTITDITYATTGATGATVTGLPAGVTGAWLLDVFTISGTPTEIGTFNYTITLTGGCGNVTTSGTIIVNPIPTTSPIFHN
jgi:Tfp pilus assembly protein FimT